MPTIEIKHYCVHCKPHGHLGYDECNNEKNCKHGIDCGSYIHCIKGPDIKKVYIIERKCDKDFFEKWEEN